MILHLKFDSKVHVYQQFFFLSTLPYRLLQQLAQRQPSLKRQKLTFASFFFYFVLYTIKPNEKYKMQIKLKKIKIENEMKKKNLTRRIVAGERERDH